MDKTVDVTIPVEPEAAAALADARNREAVGRLVSRVLRPRAGPSPLAQAISAAVADSDQYLADWVRRSEALRARMPDHLDLAYGDAPRARLDFFPAARTGAATLLFFHGGYWQRNAKEGFSFVAEGPLADGFHVAVAGYTLAPEATMDGIVREARTALRWVHQHLATLGGDPARLYVGGWSAGGHLAAMLMDEAPVAGGLAISGLFDLEPIRLSYLNEKLGLDAEQARRNSPLLNLPARAAELIIAYGSDELPELKRQSREFGTAWSARGLPGQMIEVANCHHYAVLEQLAQPDGRLAEALATSAGTRSGLTTMRRDGRVDRPAGARRNRPGLSRQS